MKPSRILITLTAFLLMLSLSASVLAAQPKQGVYVKQDSAGKISALMYVISKQGKGPLASAAPGKRNGTAGLRLCGRRGSRGRYGPGRVPPYR